MKIFFITDKRKVFETFTEILKQMKGEHEIDFFYSANDKDSQCEMTGLEEIIRPIDLKEKSEEFFARYDLFFSWHCRQIFPKNLVDNHRCVNLHPSLNPYNRGWYPQVFCIYNGLPAGVTIHEMDEKIDMGFIICQKEVEKRNDDTAYDLYQRIVSAEESLVRENIEKIIEGNYSRIVSGEGNINYKSDFVRLCELDLEKTATYKEVIDHLRALSFGEYKNAYYRDTDGKKIYIKVVLEKEQ